MNPQQQQQNPVDPDHPQLPTIKIHHPSSPRHSHHHSHLHAATPTAGARRKIGVAVDLSDESAYAVSWAVDHYIRPGDAVILLHVSPTSVLFGADWGPLPLSTPTQSQLDLLNNTSKFNNEIDIVVVRYPEDKDGGVADLEAVVNVPEDVEAAEGKPKG
ncbi:hypothetical protein H0E87_021022 [Populus deltoides]|uniref:UspA domain-containing protein n=1 Tax=Populus deltoides TaxID=3696 RepID=A0A8T2XMZ0_POPDE|nr:hypothetical protein H0E87_021022 [Populus deltoides]